MPNPRKDQKIRPATGVKVKSKKAQQPAPRPQKAKQVVPDVASPNAELPPPTEDAARILGQLNSAKDGLLTAMLEFGKLLKDSKLPENRSEEDKRKEQNSVINLMRAAGNVEQFSPTEGVLGVATFAVRQALALRDAGNRLAYDLYKLDQRVKELEKGNEEG